MAHCRADTLVAPNPSPAREFFGCCCLVGVADLARLQSVSISTVPRLWDDRSRSGVASEPPRLHGPARLAAAPWLSCIRLVDPLRLGSAGARLIRGRTR